VFKVMWAWVKTPMTNLAKVEAAIHEVG
ncbi:MAG: hypothetical protein RL333_1001, partial [Pseudomonadota bacterium]